MNEVVNPAEEPSASPSQGHAARVMDKKQKPVPPVGSPAHFRERFGAEVSAPLLEIGERYGIDARIRPQLGHGFSTGALGLARGGPGHKKEKAENKMNARIEIVEGWFSLSRTSVSAEDKALLTGLFDRWRELQVSYIDALNDPTYKGRDVPYAFTK